MLQIGVSLLILCFGLINGDKFSNPGILQRVSSLLSLGLVLLDCDADSTKDSSRSEPFLAMCLGLLNGDKDSGEDMAQPVSSVPS